MDFKASNHPDGLRGEPFNTLSTNLTRKEITLCHQR